MGLGIQRCKRLAGYRNAKHHYAHRLASAAHEALLTIMREAKSNLSLEGDAVMPEMISIMLVLAGQCASLTLQLAGCGILENGGLRGLFSR